MGGQIDPALHPSPPLTEKLTSKTPDLLGLTRFQTNVPFSITGGFLLFSWGIEVEYWLKME